MKTSFLLLPLLAAAAVSARGQSTEINAGDAMAPKESAPAEFRSLDVNEDGRISRAEFVSARPERRRGSIATATKRAGGRDLSPAEAFAEADANRDGFLSEAELANAQLARNVRSRLNREPVDRGSSEDQPPAPLTRPEVAPAGPNR